MQDLISNPQVQIVAEVAVAMILGGILGYDRELASRPAGLRTHMLVAGASALLVGLSGIIITNYSQHAGSGIVQTDPIRTIEAIITGISFLGAGTIFRSRSENDVQGLTTAATILFCSAIGICVALQELLIACCCTLLALIILRILAGSKEQQRKSAASE